MDRWARDFQPSDADPNGPRFPVELQWDLEAISATLRQHSLRFYLDRQEVKADQDMNWYTVMKWWWRAKTGSLLPPWVKRQNPQCPLCGSIWWSKTEDSDTNVDNTTRHIVVDCPKLCPPDEQAQNWDSEIILGHMMSNSNPADARSMMGEEIRRRVSIISKALKSVTKVKEGPGDMDHEEMDQITITAAQRRVLEEHGIDQAVDCLTAEDINTVRVLAEELSEEETEAEMAEEVMVAEMMQPTPQYLRFVRPGHKPPDLPIPVQIAKLIPLGAQDNIQRTPAADDPPGIGARSTQSLQLPYLIPTLNRLLWGAGQSQIPPPMAAIQMVTRPGRAIIRKKAPVTVADSRVLATIHTTEERGARDQRAAMRDQRKQEREKKSEGQEPRAAHLTDENNEENNGEEVAQGQSPIPPSSAATETIQENGVPEEDEEQ